MKTSTTTRMVLLSCLLDLTSSCVVRPYEAPDSGAVEDVPLVQQSVISVDYRGTSLASFTFERNLRAPQQGLRLVVRNTGSRTIERFSYLVQIRYHNDGDRVVFEQGGSVTQLITGAVGPYAYLLTDATLDQRFYEISVTVIDVAFVGEASGNPFAGVYRGIWDSVGTGGANLGHGNFSGTVAADGAVRFNVDIVNCYGGGITTIAGTLDDRGRFNGEGVRSDGLQLATLTTSSDTVAMLLSGTFDLTLVDFRGDCRSFASLRLTGNRGP